MSEEKIFERISFFFEKVHFFLFRRRMSPVMRSFLGDLTFSFFGIGIASIIFFALNLFAARILGVDEFGKYQLLLTAGQSLSVFMLFGLHFSSAKYISEVRFISHKKKIAGSVLYLTLLSSLVVFCVLFSFRDFISNLINFDNSVFTYSLFLGFSLSVFIICRSILQGWKKMKIISILEFFNAISAAGLFFLFFLRGELDYIHYFYAIVFGYLIFIICSFALGKRLADMKLELSILSNKFFHYALLAFFGSVAALLLGAVNKFLLNYFYDSVTVGLFTAYFFVSVGFFSQVVNVFNLVFMPYVSSAENKVDIVRKLIPISILSGLGVFFCSMGIIPLAFYFFGGEYEFQISLAVAFSLCASITVMYQMKMWFLNGSGIDGVKFSVIGALVSGVINSILTIILIPHLNIYGAVVSLFFSGLIFYIYLSKKIRVFLITNSDLIKK